ncbi:sigma-B regulation protein RsbU (phosphoserine phosphatase) [Methanocalculus alkaliphilus]|uniref:SpoIIE family protein phosphatase n=1 Tax=Methanocalculus alkaliphilus TaxID=768730 RepID=UPI00209EDD36|nr:SpoIIE family protein phosphatase [Methanocalculus alkaliphilus]MCP1714786.1 sigma-B regulation protein RsbU (phosphoserine phosphatase) [Methanocalculus alkaliphilus]
MNQPIPPMGVRTKILIAFLLISVISLLIAGGVASSAINTLGASAVSQSEALGEQAVRDSTAALLEDAEEYLLRIAIDQAEQASLHFEQTGIAILTIGAYAEALRSGRPAAPVAGTEEFIVAGTSPAIREREALAEMEDIMVSVATAHPEITWIYIGSQSGIFRVYPKTINLDPQFDHRKRDWFRDGLSSDGISWSRPYVDAGGEGLTVTCSYKIADAGDAWIVGADVTIETINQQILGTKISGDGYAMLIDKDGHVITRPGLSAEDRLWDESFTTENLLSAPNRELRAVAQKMILGESGISRISFEEREVFFAYAPVRTTGWSIAVVMPVETVIAPALLTGEKLETLTKSTSKEIDSQINRALHLFIVSMVVLIGAAIVGSAIFSQFITRPLKDLHKGATAIGKGDLEYRVTLQTKDEFESLGESFNTMAGELKAMMANLERETAERERLSRELEIAHHIQESFLPDRAPAVPGFDLAARSIPALFVGGDFYDFIPIGENRYGLVIADVSGKGVSAALFMALSRTLVRASTADEPSPATAITQANRLIYEDSKTSMFVTLFYAILDANNNTLTYVNAGHNPPVFIRGDDATITLLRADGIALGVIEEIALETVTIPLTPGDLLVLYTDGVTEAENAAEELYGEERLEALMTEIRGRGASEIIDAIIDDIKEYAGEAPQSDDITLLVLKAKDGEE